MNDEKGKRKIVNYVNLCWHEFKPETEGIMICVNCITTYDANDLPNQLDPTTPENMYGKIWPAFVEQHGYADFIKWVHRVNNLDDLITVGNIAIFGLMTAERLANLLLDFIAFIEQKEGE